MKLIFVQDSLGTGGAERSNAELWYYLRKKKVSIKIIVLKHRKEGIEQEILSAGFDVSFIKETNIFRQALEIRHLIKIYQPTLVHSILFRSNIRVRLLRLFTSFIHLESLVNEVYSEYRLSDSNVNRFKLEGYRLLDRITQIFGVDHFHANGISVAKHYRQKLGISTKRITIIPRGRERNTWVGNVENRARVRAEFQTGNRFLIINVARHEFQKGHDVLIEAVHHLQNKTNIQVVLVGREGKQTPLIKEKIEEYQLHDCIKLVGHRNDVSAILAAADIFVFPSRFEGLPGALIEAAAAGLPIICSDIPNNREVAIENENALFFPVDDSRMLSQQLNRVIGDSALQMKFGSESLTRFNKHFLIEEVHQRMEKLLVGITKVDKQ